MEGKTIGGIEYWKSSCMHRIPITTYRVQEVADDQNQLKNLGQDLTLKNIYRKMQLHLSEFKLLLALVYQVFSVITQKTLWMVIDRTKRL